jgi:phytoene synthase
MTTLEAAYAECRAVTRRSGTTYYWSTFVLPPVKRHHVWALYALCRTADDIVDVLDDRPTAERADALAAYGDRLRDALDAGSSDDPVLHALAHTVRAFAIDPTCFDRFLRSMTMDLTVDSYETWDDLLVYTDGSAAVIGEMMLPILEPSSPAALPHARDLGTAFQLTNFLRDVAEDLDRGRLYLPLEDVRRFGADPSARRVDGAWIELMRFEIARCRRLYESADLGIALLPSASARCVRTARVLYSGILERIERAGYDVFAGRVRVPTARKALTAITALRPAG